jgi:hypothetical protein
MRHFGCFDENTIAIGFGYIDQLRLLELSPQKEELLSVIG